MPGISESVWLSPEDRRAAISEPLMAALRKKLLESLARGSLLNLSHRDNSRTHVRVAATVIDQVFDVLFGGNGGTGEFVWLDEPPQEPHDERTQCFDLAFQSALRIDSAYQRLVDDLDSDDESDQRLLAESERRIKDRVREALGLPPRLQKGVQTPAEIARAQGINPSFELKTDFDGDAASTSIKLQTMLFHREMAAKMNALRTSAQRAMEETGANALNAILGFLEWTPSGGRDRRMLSPLLIAPVEFSASVWQSRKRFVVSGQGDDPVVNPALQVQIAAQEQVVLPPFDEDEKPSAYFERIEKLISQKENWRVRTFLTVGLLESAIINIWQDLDPGEWPEGTAPHLHNTIADLLAGSGERTDAFGEDYDIDSKPISDNLLEPVLDADSSQLSAMVDVLDGNNLAIQGPPGTGKSQTIANIITASMRLGKTVLFVAEKMAALDAVKKRLDDVGLGDYVLELHSTKVRRATVYQGFVGRLQLRRRLDPPADYENRLRELNDLKRGLNAYVKAINTPLGATGRTVHEAVWRLRLLTDRLADSDLPVEMAALSLQGARDLDSVAQSTIAANLRQFQEAFEECRDAFGSMEDHPWRFVTNELVANPLSPPP